MGAALAFAGSVLISVSDFQLNSRAFLGDIMALAGAVFIAGYFLIGRNLRQRMSLTLYTFLVYGSCTVVLLAMALITSTPLSPGPPMNIVMFLLMAIIPTLSGHSIFNWALGYVQASVVSVAMLGEPVFATILAVLILGEIPTIVQAYGGIVIIIGLYIFIMTTERSEGESIKMKFRVYPEVFEKLPNVCFGVVVGYGIDNSADLPGREQLLVSGVEDARKNLAGQDIKTVRQLIPYRRPLATLGFNPNKYPSSIEAMLKRVLKGNDIPPINGVVDICNALSLEYLLPMGAHDMDALEGRYRGEVCHR
jgi:drug/metabolite transporter superfamily protein YnfA